MTLVPLPWDVVLCHVFLAVTLFLLINWVGRHSFSIGYMEISVLVKEEEAPAFNFVFRVLSPVVYLFIVSSILYSVSLDRYVDHIYYVSLYYVLFRLAFNLATNRSKLLNWGRQFVYWAGILALSFFAYDKLISARENIFPDFKTFANELWIIILIFLYQTMNNLRFSSAKSEQRKENYLTSRLKTYRTRFGDIINELAPNPKLQALVYAVIVYEDFNRPRVVRIFENLMFRMASRSMSLGIMQVRTDKLLTDLQSVELGVKKMLRAKELSESKLNLEIDTDPSGMSNWNLEYTLTRDILKDYNPDDDYINEVVAIADLIETKHLHSKGQNLASPHLIARVKDS